MALDYSKLSACYPGVDQPSKDGYANQCAIRLSLAMQCAGWDFSDYDEPKTSEGWARGAQSLAWYLWRRIGLPRRHRGNDASIRGRLASMRGIIFFRDIRGFRNGTGDHIDLWNGLNTRGAEPFGYCKEVWTWRL